MILPSLVPAITAGAALSFARGISEYGSLVLLSGNLPNRTEVVVGAGPVPHRERRPRLGGSDRVRHAGDRARRDRRPRRPPAKGGPRRDSRTRPRCGWGLRGLRDRLRRSAGRSGRSALVVTHTFADGFGNVIQALVRSRGQRGAQPHRPGDRLVGAAQPRLRGRASRCCWCATTSRASGRCPRWSTCRCRSRRSSSAWP